MDAPFDAGCVFCRIVRGEAPAHKVHEDELTLTMMDIAPVTDGHTLVITRGHYDDMFAAPAAALRAVATTAKRVAHSIRTTLAPHGLMVFQLNGSAAGQTVFHYHLHLMPRSEGQPLALHARVPGDPSRLAELAARLAAAMDGEVSPNAEQIAYWNESVGPTWVLRDELLDGQIRPLGLHTLDRLALAPGERVLDVGCGCGSTTVEIARRVHPDGSVLGVDLSRPMLERAHRRASEAGVEGARFENADAQVHPFPAGSFDVVFSRFGVMFFADPEAAFRNLRAALRPGGRLGFVCWRGLAENPWMMVPMMAAAQHLTMPPPPAPDAPGPFSLADPERVRSILERAGLVDVEIEPHDETLTIGGSGSLDQAVDFLLDVGPAARALREAAGAGLRPRVAAAIRDALAPFHGPTGVRMGSASWIVRATRAANPPRL
jgi:diadenosine tetraphosphate (Ap4A) HIT family hydrolase/SAM-dependent methyltransferase